MFIVANKEALRVSRQGCLACTGKAEENSRFLCYWIHVGRAVHGQDPFLGHEIIHDREDALFDFTGIARAYDEDLMGFVVNEDGCFRMDAVAFGIAMEARCGDDGEIRFAILIQLGCRRPDQ